MEKLPALKFRVPEALTESGGVVPGNVLFQLEKNAFGSTIAIFWVRLISVWFGVWLGHDGLLKNNTLTNSALGTG